MPANTTPIEELEPCPFCGKPPRTCPDNSYGTASVFCPDANECLVQPVADADLSAGETLADAIHNWNTRPITADQRLGLLVREGGEEVVEKVAAVVREHHRTHVRYPTVTNEPRKTFHQGDDDTARAVLRTLEGLVK